LARRSKGEDECPPDSGHCVPWNMVGTVADLTKFPFIKKNPFSGYSVAILGGFSNYDLFFLTPET
jgi:hypothetical protein